MELKSRLDDISAAGDGNYRETIENIIFATGKFYEEQCTELADAILNELKVAGDGKEEAVAFQDWVQENCYTYSGAWMKLTPDAEW